MILVEKKNIESKMNENNLYKEMYFILFAKVSDAIDLLEKGYTEEAIKLLKEAELLTEDMYIQNKIKRT